MPYYQPEETSESPSQHKFTKQPLAQTQQ